MDTQPAEAPEQAPPQEPTPQEPTKAAYTAEPDLTPPKNVLDRVIEWALDLEEWFKRKVNGPVRIKHAKGDFECCNAPTLMPGYVWSMKSLPVAVCLNCEHVEALFGPIGSVLLFIGNIFNTEPHFTIQWYKRDPDQCLCGSMLDYKNLAGRVAKVCTKDKCKFSWNPELFSRED